jgi:hypothetical protein
MQPSFDVKQSIGLFNLSAFIGGSMRYLQIVIFIIALMAFISALFFIGSDTGDVLWRMGVAILLLDIVCIMLWPRPLGEIAN